MFLKKGGKWSAELFIYRIKCSNHGEGQVALYFVVNIEIRPSVDNKCNTNVDVLLATKIFSCHKIVIAYFQSFERIVLWFQMCSGFPALRAHGMLSCSSPTSS